MSEAAITETGGAASAASGAAEHYLTRVLTGEPATAHERLADALEALGYHVLGVEPLEARRGARGVAARIHTSNNVLDYPVALRLAVKAAGAGASRVTFFYRLRHPLLSASGRATLTREAEAVVALAALRATATRCVACGASAAAGSRFCRQCGTPSAKDEPSEFEVLRVTAGTCASFQLTTLGALLLLGATLALSAAWFDWLGRARLFAWVAVAVAVAGWALLLAGLRRMHSTLNPSRPESSEVGLTAGAVEAATSVLPGRPRPAHDSTGEHTTRLLRETAEEDSAEDSAKAADSAKTAELKSDS